MKPMRASFVEAYAGLNPEQKKAVDTIDGPVMVIAGPGTGKTQVLALRVGNILNRTDLPPGSILCLTFTDAAQVNMRERLSELIGPAAFKVAIHTFHGFARAIITDYPEYFYGGADFTAADDLGQREILEEIFRALSRSDPLASVHEGEYIYLSAAQSSISDLKRAGLTPNDLDRILAENAEDLVRMNEDITRVFGERLGKGSTLLAVELAKKWSGDGGSPHAVPPPRLIHAAAASLSRAAGIALADEKTAPLSSWKEKWTTRDGNGTRVLKDTMTMEKMTSLARVFRQYQEKMRAARLYDFDDMLLDVISAMEEHPALLYALEERYQYILVDEFQDTNDAQLRLIRLIGSAPVNEGRPNIMIVGDDDQAIFRFQGAEISNIIDFPKQYTGHELIVLTKNYRSTQEILDVSREVILKSGERLETAYPALRKILVASRPDLGQGHIRHVTLPTRAHEHAHIARAIASLIKEGSDPRTIAVITKRHRELEDIARVLVSSGIPIKYERKQNVFHEPHIRTLITMARFITSIIRHGRKEADELLPTLLSSPIWGLSRVDVWRIAQHAADRSDRSWLAAMEEDENERVRAIAGWFMELASRALSDPLERILDEMIGTDGVLLPRQSSSFLRGDDEHEDSTTPFPHENARHNFRSPLREYYFGTDARKKAEARYLMFLSSLRVFVGALREYKKGNPLFLEDMVAFVDLNERNRLILSDTTPFASAHHAVNLMTAHKAKGLEFDTVFVASCQDDVWAGRGFPDKIPFPMNLRIKHEDSDDDRLRVFYVALTRARKHLFLSSYRHDDAGKASLRTGFILPDEEDGAIARNLKEEEEDVPDNDLLGSLDVMPMHPEFFPIVPGEKAILLELLRDYTMSVTHLNNFLNIARGGPQLFLEQNLLRFPQAMAPASAYGDAMHRSIERLYREFQRAGRVPSEKDLIGWFDEAMDSERMTRIEREHFREAGHKALPVWYRVSGKGITTAERSEVNFARQGVVLAGVPVTGKIDKMSIHDDSIIVTDFKTGKAKATWDGRTPDEAITLSAYRRQLIFYKLLVENAHDFAQYRVSRGYLEFLEPVDGEIRTLPLDITDDDASRLIDLIRIVHEKISTLDFPDTASYSPDADGINAFEDDLLSGKI